MIAPVEKAAGHPVNLWILNHYAITPDMPGGARHYELARRLVQKGYSVTIFASSFHHMLHMEMRLQPGETVKQEIVDGVRFIWLRTRPYGVNSARRMLNMLDYTFQAYRHGRNAHNGILNIPKPDVVIGSSVHLFAALSAYLLARRHRAHFVSEIRDLWPQTLVDFGHYGPRHPLVLVLRRLESFIYRRSERVITLLPGSLDYIHRRGVPRERLMWLPNGVETGFFASTEDRRTKGAPFTVGYVGSHGVANNLNLVLEAALILKDQGHDNIRFSFVGDGPDKQRLIAKAEHMGLRNVIFMDAVPRTQVPDVLAEMDVLTLTPPAAAIYQYGLSPNKLFEYMAAGKPVVLACEPPENPIALANCGFTVAGGDAPGVAEAIMRAYAMPPAEREAMGLRGREYVRQHHDWDVLAERLHQCIQSVLSTKAPQLAARS